MADVVTDYRIRTAIELNVPLFGATEDAVGEMPRANLAPSGTLDDLIADSDIVVDCTPKKIAGRNRDRYDAAGRKAIFQGGEKHALTGFSDLERDGARSMAMTDASLGIRRRFLGAPEPATVALSGSRG